MALLDFVHFFWVLFTRWWLVVVLVVVPEITAALFDSASDTTLDGGGVNRHALIPTLLPPRIAGGGCVARSGGEQCSLTSAQYTQIQIKPKYDLRK
jgi:hypothetical protein